MKEGIVLLAQRRDGRPGQHVLIRVQDPKGEAGRDMRREAMRQMEGQAAYSLSCAARCLKSSFSLVIACRADADSVDRGKRKQSARRGREAVASQ